MNINKLQPFLLPFKILASKAFLLWIIFAWISYYSITSIWMDEAFGSFISLLREHLLFQIPFLLFLAAAMMNLIRVSKKTFQRSRLGYFFWLILPLGTIIFFSGFFVSVTQREHGQRIIGEGDIISPPWSRETYNVVAIDPGLPDRLTGMEQSRGIFAYEPKMTVLDRFSQKSDIGAFPPKKLNDTYYHILNLGIAPGVRLLQGGNIINQGYKMLRILTPGSSDSFEIPPYPYKFLVSLEPESRREQGRDKVAEFNLKEPLYNVRVLKGEKIIAEGDSRKGINLDNMTLHFFRPIYWALVEAVKDPAMPVMHAGVVLITFGLPLYLMQLLVRSIKGKNVINNQ